MGYKSIPKWFFRIKTFERTYNKYLNLLNTAEKDNYSDIKLVKKIFDKIKDLFEYYWKIIISIYNNNGLDIKFPREALERFRDENPSINVDIWLEYLDVLNDICFEEELGKNGMSDLEVINKYKKYVPEMYTYTQDLYAKYSFYDEHKTFSLDMFPDYKPEYTPEEVCLKEKYYNMLMKCFKSFNDLEYVWVHGSRAKGLSKETSDIDLFVEIPYNRTKTLSKVLKNLQIPYEIDVEHKNDSLDFLLLSESFYAKPIYRKIDFK